MTDILIMREIVDIIMVMYMIIMVMITMVSLTFADHVNHDKVDDHACTNDYDKDVVDDDEEDSGYCDGDNGEEQDHDDGRMVMMKLIMRLMQGHTQKYSQVRMFSYLLYHIGNCVVVSLLYPIQINGISLLVPSELILRTIYMGGSSIFQPRTFPENRNYGMDQKQFSHV